MTRRNRVDPWGDLHADPGRGLFTGNRGCLVDDDRRLVHHHRSSTLWITCRLRFRGRRRSLDQPHVWTPLFFLDDAVALAAGHRPCATCRREDYTAFRDAVSPAGRRLRAAEIDDRLAGERLRRGRGRSRGLDRAADRPLWRADAEALPAGTVVVVRGVTHLVTAAALQPFMFAGWGPPVARPAGVVDVLTPATSVAALAAGFPPTLHPTAS